MSESSLLPDHVLRLMDPSDRKLLGKAGVTAVEAQAKYAGRLERHRQQTFASWLDLRGLYYICPRTDRKSTIRKGAPDFHILHNGLGICIEFKREGCELSPDQKAVHFHLERNGVPHFVVNDAGEAIRITQRFFGL